MIDIEEREREREQELWYLLPTAKARTGGDPSFDHMNVKEAIPN